MISEAEPANDFSPTRSTHREALAEALLDVAPDGRGRVSRKGLGWYLRHFEGRIAGGLRLTKKDRHGSQKHAHQYRIEQAAAATRAGGLHG